MDLGIDATGADGEPLEMLATKSSHLWEALCTAYRVLGFDAAVDGDAVFRDLVLARIIEPTSKADSLRVLAETGVASVDYRTVTRHLPRFAKPAVRQQLSAACAARAGLGPASLVLYDVSTLYFETDTADGFREPGFSKERRLEPQITIGLLTDASGLPLAVESFEGNKAETATMLPRQLDEPVAFHRGMPVDRALGLGDLLVDPTQGAPGPVVPALVVGDPIRDPAGLFRTGRRPRLGQHQPIRNCLIGVFVTPFTHHIGQERNSGAQDVGPGLPT